jgi:sialate O-acetylesterase
LESSPASFTPQELLIETLSDPPERLVIRDVLVGEVWVAGGQSNMAYGVNTAWNSKEEIANANHPGLRVFDVQSSVADKPRSTLNGSWKVCSPATVGEMSATGYFFARDLQKILNVPIGLLQNAESGTLAEAWMSESALTSDPDFQPILDRHQAAVEAYKTTSSAGHSAENPPRAVPPDPETLTTRPSGLFNARVAPLTPYAIRGVIWWQGEYNSERGEQYRKLFPALIQDWRAHWNNLQLPFLFVQLQNYDIQPQPNAAHYDELREAQLMTHRSVPNTGMVVACDVGDPNDIHPPNKQPVGHRLSLLARNLVYGEKDLICSGPLYKDFRVKGSAIKIHFDHVGGGLILKNGKALTEFEVAGTDKIFHPANAEIDGDAIIVSSPEVPHPVAVRYAWRDNPTCSLFNAEGLPASPFRTDNWPVHSTGIR